MQEAAAWGTNSNKYWAACSAPATRHGPWCCPIYGRTGLRCEATRGTTPLSESSISMNYEPSPTWRRGAPCCMIVEGVSFVVEGDEHKCDAFAPPAAYAFSLMKKHARAYEAPSLVQTCVVAPGAVALNKLPRCAVGVDVREFLLLGPCTKRLISAPRSKALGPAAAWTSLRSPCRDGFRWDSALNASSSFLGLVSPRREETHLAPCAAHALGRLDASEPRARALLTALRAAPPLRTVVAHAMKSTGTYDAVHVRLGDFGSLCAKRPKFCPPSDAELSPRLRGARRTQQSRAGAPALGRSR